jgi:hypothetical protein
LQAAAQVNSNAAIKILLARTSNPTTVLAGEVDMVSEVSGGGDDAITLPTLGLRTEKEHPSASSGKLAITSKQYVKGERQRGNSMSRQGHSA